MVDEGKDVTIRTVSKGPEVRRLPNRTWIIDGRPADPARAEALEAALRLHDERLRGEREDG